MSNEGYFDIPKTAATPSSSSTPMMRAPGEDTGSTAKMVPVTGRAKTPTPSELDALLNSDNKPPDPSKSDIIYQEMDDIECYHGNLLEEDMKKILIKHGDFIIRTVSKDEMNEKSEKTIVVTVLWKGAIIDIILISKYSEKRDENSHTLDLRTYQNSVKDLIRRHQMMSVPVVIGKEKEVLLLNPIAQQSWELRGENVILVKKLGEGAFGEVYAGKLRLRMKKSTNAAIKVIKRCANTEKATRELQKEAAIMRKFKHTNIVRFHGMVVGREKIMIVMELINGGGLDKYLRKNKDKVIANERGGYAYDIACGLAYLHMQNVMHRDVACRNCLLDLTKKIAKVSDFGLAKQAKEYHVSSDDRLPIRWTAPEVLKTLIYTQKADTYAYAILVWEIFSNAQIPFDGYTNAQIKAGVHDDDFRPKFPGETPFEVIDVAISCWSTDPKKRPELIDVARKSLAKFSRPSVTKKNTERRTIERFEEDYSLLDQVDMNKKNSVMPVKKKKAVAPKGRSRDLIKSLVPSRNASKSGSLMRKTKSVEPVNTSNPSVSRTPSRISDYSLL